MDNKKYNYKVLLKGINSDNRFLIKILLENLGIEMIYIEEKEINKYKTIKKEKELIVYECKQGPEFKRFI